MTALVQIGSVGPHAVLVEQRLHPRKLVLQDLPALVNADGANGQSRGTPARARELGLWVPPGADTVPLAAYHPDDWGRRKLWLPAGRGPLGLDAPENGGHAPDDAWGWVVEDGAPLVQGEGDPAPGYLVSTAALRDHRLPESDPASYFDSAGAPGWTLPAQDLERYGVQLGDLALVSFGPYKIWAQAFDSGHPAGLLELSVHACSALGIPDCGRAGGVKSGVDIVILPGSGTWLVDHLSRRRPGTTEEINEAGLAAARAVGMEL